MLQRLIAAPCAFDAVSSEALLGEYLRCLCLQNGGGEEKEGGKMKSKLLPSLCFSPLSSI